MCTQAPALLRRSKRETAPHRLRPCAPHGKVCTQAPALLRHSKRETAPHRLCPCAPRGKVCTQTVTPLRCGTCKTVPPSRQVVLQAGLLQGLARTMAKVPHTCCFFEGRDCRLHQGRNTPRFLTQPYVCSTCFRAAVHAAVCPQHLCLKYRQRVLAAAPGPSCPWKVHALEPTRMRVECDKWLYHPAQSFVSLSHQHPKFVPVRRKLGKRILRRDCASADGLPGRSVHFAVQEMPQHVSCFLYRGASRRVPRVPHFGIVTRSCLHHQDQIWRYILRVHPLHTLLDQICRHVLDGSALVVIVALQIVRACLHQAVNALHEEGHLVKHRGRGTLGS